MIRNTFVLLKGISYNKEKELWQQGIRTWEDFIRADTIFRIGQKRKAHYNTILQNLSTQLENEYYNEILNILPRKYHYRLFDELKDNAVYLDIECYSAKDNNLITLVGLSDGDNTRITSPHASGWNVLLDNIEGHKKIIVTYNGNVHDMPIIARHSRKSPKAFFFDLRFLLNELGITGGLKEAEYDFNITRDDSAIRKSGEPLALWKQFLATQDEYYLELLHQYLKQDVESLIIIAEEAIKKYKAMHGFIQNEKCLMNKKF